MHADGDQLIGYQDIVDAMERVSAVAHRTPLTSSHTFSRMTGCEVTMKLENLQRTGAFKLRGAWNRLFTLSRAEARAGVVSASAGNHAQGVALASQLLGIPCTIIMPEGAPAAKIEATQAYGAHVHLHGATYDDACHYAITYAAARSATYVHAFDDPLVIAGQGTIALEVLQDHPDIDAIVVPVGGGGLIAGVAVAVKAVAPHIRVIGVQAEGAAATVRSLEAGRRITLPHVSTLADGIAVKTPGQLTFPLIEKFVDDVVTVSESYIAKAMLLLLERSKMLVEGAGASTLAALLSPSLSYLKGKRVALLISGGNVDLSRVARLEQAPAVAQV